ncbi:MAG: S41 family peptidase [Polyangiaceae bacterium]|nr:S41 family peptidase [Polyangiaceae bacterium]
MNHSAKSLDKRIVWGALALASVSVAVFAAVYWQKAAAPPSSVPVASTSASPLSSRTPGTLAAAKPIEVDPDSEDSYVFRIPSGEPTALSCEEARVIIEQVRGGLAYSPEAVPRVAFATATADWLDPHGLLSLATDAPTSRAIAVAAPELLADLEGRHHRQCISALGPGTVLEAWSNELRDFFDRGRLSHAGIDASVAAIEPLPVVGTAKEIAFEIGRRVGAFEATQGERGRAIGDEARRRFFPPLDKEGWAKVVIASAVRAYVPLVDPHGEWAPFDEESHIYELDLLSHPPRKLWEHAVPTAVGVRVSDGVVAPLADGDVILSVSHVATAGLPLEQIDQLGFASLEGVAASPLALSMQKASHEPPLMAVVLRDGALVSLNLAEAKGDADADTVADDLPSERIAYGDGDVLVVTIKDVRDDLGDDLAALLDAERSRSPRKLVGLALDLRGNGGGSTDGALGAISLFLPSVPLFSMKRRDGSIEVDHSPTPREHDRWTGPVATFVNGTTASAAEMIAGALAVYRRGVSIGVSTFGKGCAQEYVDDDAHAGVLRLTTLVYALADGSPVQRIGLAPQIRFAFQDSDNEGTSEREATLARSAPPWRGPDLRDPETKRQEALWPPSGGVVGPCKDADTCRALRLLGAGRRAALAKH